ncbi:MAG TPA: hypothetical protein VNZ22_12015 [Bacillota bacterium]|nr:hypothetical protein [Bacillota bacterium]
MVQRFWPPLMLIVLWLQLLPAVAAGPEALRPAGVAKGADYDWPTRFAPGVENRIVEAVKDLLPRRAILHSPKQNESPTLQND